MLKNYLILFSIVFASCNSKGNRLSIVCHDSVAVSNAVKLSSSEIYSSKTIDGKTISIEGLFSYNFEDVALYPKKTGNDHKGIWLKFSDKIMEQDSLLTKLNGKQVVITGTVDISDKGHLSSYFFSLFNIVCIREK